MTDAVFERRPCPRQFSRHSEIAAHDWTVLSDRQRRLNQHKSLKPMRFQGLYALRRIGKPVGLVQADSRLPARRQLGVSMTALVGMERASLVKPTEPPTWNT